MDDDGIWLPADSLGLQGGTISAAADTTVAATLTYVQPGTQSLHKVDGGTTNTVATGTPAITGTPQVDQMLTAGMDDIDDDDGLPSTVFPAGYTFQWVSVDSSTNETNVGTDSSTYSPTSTDEGSTIKVKVSFTDLLGNAETVTSDAKGPVLPAAGPCPAGYDWCTTMTVGSRAGGPVYF